MQALVSRRWCWLFLTLSLGGPGLVLGQRRGAGEEYRVGYRRIQRYDVARSFDPSRRDSLRFRPVQLDVFYPAHQPAPGRPLPYGYFLSLYGSRMNFGLSADSCRRVGAQLADYLSQGLGLAAAPALAALPTHSVFAAPMAPGPFPLVLYCPGYNGLSYENLELLERLASQGYLVASVSSVGKFPGYMTTDPVDVSEQVADAKFARTYLQQTAPVARQQVAALGYSWGGLAATLLAGQEPPLQAVISLDGNDRHYYGEDAAEDAQFARIRQALALPPPRLAAPHLYLSSGREAAGLPLDSAYALATSFRAACYVRLPGTQHEDFSCLPLLAHRLDARRPFPTAYALTERLVSSWLGTYLGPHASFPDTLRALLRQQPARLTLAPPALAPAGAAPPRVLTGTTTDAHGHPLPYVSLGLVGGNQGTVSGADGTFTLRLRGVRGTDTLRLSCVGYRSQGWRLATLSARAQKQPLRLALQAQPAALPAVVVRATRPMRRVLGNATTSKFFNAGFGAAGSGAQVGIPLHLGTRPVAVEKVVVRVSYNRYDSLLLRLNVYRLERGVPTRNLLRESVFVRLGGQSGAVTFDLARRPLSVAGNVLVAVELLEGWGGPDKALFLAAGLLNGPTYYRQTSEGAWRRAKGVGVGIQATAVVEDAP